jgi:hypothetical protein
MPKSIEQLIDEVRLDADGPSQKMGNEHPGERWLLFDHADNRRFFQAHDHTSGVRESRENFLLSYYYNFRG